MANLQIQQVQTQEQIQSVAQLARAIWSEHYAGILSADQIEYMIEKFQSPTAIQSQMRSAGYEYYLLCCGGTNAGFMGIQPGEDKLFLSKLYLKKEFRGKKLARQALEFLEERSISDGMSSIWLTVNRNNESSIKAYQKMGFQMVKPQISPIGNGYVMDDYVMEKPVN